MAEAIHNELEEKSEPDAPAVEMIEQEDAAEFETVTAEADSDPVEEPQRASFASPWVLLIIGLLIGGLAGFSLYPLVVPEKAEANAAPLAGVEASDQLNEPEPHQAVMLAVIAGARHFNGDPNAPITLVEFGDFNCGYCARWAQQTLPLIQEKYIKTGKVRMAYVHFPILGPDSMTAAEGTECAAEQGKFWEYHNTLYANIGIGYTPEHLTGLAGQLEMDTDAFAACLSNFPDRKSLEDDIRLSQVMGVRGTPAFLVNGVPLAGAYPYEEFEKIIESQLAVRAPEPGG